MTSDQIAALREMHDTVSRSSSDGYRRQADALRAALDAVTQRDKLDEIIRWALGESETDHFPNLPNDWPKRKFYWRNELRRRYQSVVPPAPVQEP